MIRADPNVLNTMTDTVYAEGSGPIRPEFKILNQPKSLQSSSVAAQPESAAWREDRGRRDGPGSAAECHGRWRIQVPLERLPAGDSEGPG